MFVRDEELKVEDGKAILKAILTPLWKGVPKEREVNRRRKVCEWEG